LSEDPADIAYQLTTSRLRFYASQYHIDLGKKLRNQASSRRLSLNSKRLTAPIRLQLWPRRKLSRPARMIQRAKTKPAAEQMPEERSLTPAHVEKRREQKKFAALEPLPELKPLNAALSI
jgi:hypothetical protein